MPNDPTLKAALPLVATVLQRLTAPLEAGRQVTDYMVKIASCSVCQEHGVGDLTDLVYDSVRLVHLNLLGGLLPEDDDLAPTDRITTAGCVVAGLNPNAHLDAATERPGQESSVPPMGARFTGPDLLPEARKLVLAFERLGFGTRCYIHGQWQTTDGSPIQFLPTPARVPAKKHSTVRVGGERLRFHVKPIEGSIMDIEALKAEPQPAPATGPLFDGLSGDPDDLEGAQRRQGGDHG